MTKNEEKLIEIIRKAEDPSEAIKKATEIILSYLKDISPKKMRLRESESSSTSGTACPHGAGYSVEKEKIVYKM